MAAITSYYKINDLTQIYYLTALQIRSLTPISLGKDQGVGEAHSLLEAPGENPFPYVVHL